MYLTGYHGTTNKRANETMSTGLFKISTGNKQWLGDGIYFYPNFEDAYNWRYNENDPLPEAVIHSIIKVEPSEYLDMDSEKGFQIFTSMVAFIANSAGVTIDNSKVQENQCAVAKMIWESSKDLKVLAASLPASKTKMRTLIDTRTKRKEFCVRDNSSIVYLNLIKRGEIDG